MSQTHIPAAMRRLVRERVTERLLQFNHPDRIKEREQLLAAGLLAIPRANNPTV